MLLAKPVVYLQDIGQYDPTRYELSQDTKIIVCGDLADIFFQ